jgi:hypothetical protein
MGINKNNIHSPELDGAEFPLDLSGLGDEFPEDLGPDLSLEGLLGPSTRSLRSTTVFDLSTTVFLSVSLTTVLSVLTVFDFSTNSFLEVDDEKTGGLSDEPALRGVFSGTQRHELNWNLSSLVHSAAILLLILLPQNEPVDDGPERKNSFRWNFFKRNFICNDRKRYISKTFGE